MHTARYCFGYTTFQYGRFIIIVGGAIEKNKQTTACEFYDINKNQWRELPRLKEAKYSSSIVNVNNKMIYCFGGAT